MQGRQHRFEASGRRSAAMLLMACTVVSAVTSCGSSDAAATGGASGDANPSALGARISPFPTIAAQDSATAAAQRALRDGRPFEASRLLEPAMRDPSRRTPDVELLAAEAAAGWGGWDRVLDLVQDASWLSSRFDGYGHELLARAALALDTRGRDSLAVRHARLSMPLAKSDRARALRAVLLARGHDRLRADDSAARHYLAAAEALPPVADWLRLRAAGVMHGAPARQREYARVRGDVARARVPWTEAFALERDGDRIGAAEVFERLGARAAALRLRVLDTDAAGRAPLRRDALAYLAGLGAGAESRAMIELFDGTLAPLAPNEELAVARGAARNGLYARAATGFARARAAGQGTDADILAHGDALIRVGRPRDAATVLAAMPASSRNRGAAAYQRARAIQRSGGAATAALSAVARDFAADTAAAASALYLLGDLASDAGRDTDARAHFLSLATRYPTSSQAGSARFRAAIIAYARRDFRTAARELDALRSSMASHGEASAAAYWAARSFAATGDSAGARERWKALADRPAPSYYGMRAASALGRKAWWRPAPDAPAGGDRAIDEAASRAAMLEELGLLVEARFEEDAIVAAAGDDPSRLVIAASALRAREQPSRAMTLARRALERGAPPTSALYRILYPVTQEPVLRAASTARGLDPALVAALIRQESNFTPRATSGAGARGLMQVMPTVGTAIARTMGLPLWDPVLLYQPDVNVEIGTRHLSTALRRYSDPALALAAYNAGDSRVRRWRTLGGASDVDLFVERIPFVETRDYVRIVLLNRELYRTLYDWK